MSEVMNPSDSTEVEATPNAIIKFLARYKSVYGKLHKMKPSEKPSNDQINGLECAIELVINPFTCFFPFGVLINLVFRRS